MTDQPAPGEITISTAGDVVIGAPVAEAIAHPPVDQEEGDD